MKTKLTLLSILIVLSSIAYGQTISIYRSGSLLSPTYSSIDTALKATIDGDSLVLSPHLFEQYTLVINKSIIICGTILSSGTRTVLKSNNISGPVVCILSPSISAPLLTVVIKDIDITGGSHTSAGIVIYKGGGGIYANKNTHLFIDGNTRIYNNLVTVTAETTSSATIQPGLGGGIMSEGNVSLRGNCELYANKAHFAGAVYCNGTLIMEENAQIRNNLCIYSAPAVAVVNAILRDHSSVSANDSGGIYYHGVLSLKDSAQICYNTGIGVAAFYASFTVPIIGYPLFALPYGSLMCENAARIHHNKGVGAYCQYTQLSGNSSIDSNEGIGLDIMGVSISKRCSKIQDSARIWGNRGGVNSNDSLEISGQSSILFNGSKRTGGIFAHGFLHIKDSAVIGFNTVDTNYGAGIHLWNSTLLMEGGQIIGNRSSWDTLSGIGMGIYMNNASATISKARIFNPTGDTVQQNELFIIDSLSTFQSDSTWWGDGDTSKIFRYPYPAKFNLNSWVKANWSLNGGLPVGALSVVPFEASFSLNSGAALPSGMFWMLAGRYYCDSGFYTPPLAFMSPANIISSMYTAPFTTRYNSLLGVVDADSFITNVTLTGTVNKEYEFAKRKFSVFPNPTSGSIYIESSHPIVDAKIFDIRGLMIHHFEEKINNPINLNLPAGMYLIEAGYEDKSKERKCLVVY
ncbi:MAG: T9SS type A sorting domain-containing protein [Bacteroidota bacterium]